MSSHLICQRIHHMPPSNSRIIHPGPIVVPVKVQICLQFFSIIQEVVNSQTLPFYPDFFANGPGYLLSKNQRTLLKTINEPKIGIPDLL
jgi:hypothetical protein